MLPDIKKSENKSICNLQFNIYLHINVACFLLLIFLFEINQRIACYPFQRST